MLVLVEQGPARFEKSPKPVNAHINGPALLHAEVRGSQPLIGQWLHEGTPIPHATNRQFMLVPSQLTNAGNYIFAASNSAASVASAPVAVSISALPIIATEPRRLAHPPGSPLRIAATTHGAPPLNHQWQFNGANILESSRFSGTQSEELILSPATYADSGDFTLVVSNANGIVTGLVAQVLVTPIIAWGDNAADQLNIPPGLSKW